LAAKTTIGRDETASPVQHLEQDQQDKHTSKNGKSLRKTIIGFSNAALRDLGLIGLWSPVRTFFRGQWREVFADGGFEEVGDEKEKEAQNGRYATEDHDGTTTRISYNTDSFPPGQARTLRFTLDPQTNHVLRLRIIRTKDHRGADILLFQQLFSAGTGSTGNSSGKEGGSATEGTTLVYSESIQSNYAVSSVAEGDSFPGTAYRNASAFLEDSHPEPQTAFPVFLS
ncbi:unnamed protein product, partial [Amoebophrya sp. A120]